MSRKVWLASIGFALMAWGVYFANQGHYSYNFGGMNFTGMNGVGWCGIFMVFFGLCVSILAIVVTEEPISYQAIPSKQVVFNERIQPGQNVFCPYCGLTHIHDAIFCPFCGKEIK